MAAVSSVRQWRTKQDGLDNIYLESAPVAQPGKDEVLVEIKAVSLNYRDTEGTILPLRPRPVT